MKTLRLLLLSILPFTFFCLGSAKPLDVFFGTGGRGAEGIYHATFNPDNGKFSPARLAAKIGSPGFLTLHPNGKILYSVGRWEAGAGAVGYHINNGELKEFTRMACPDGGGCQNEVTTKTKTQPRAPRSRRTRRAAPRPPAPCRSSGWACRAGVRGSPGRAAPPPDL